MTRAHSTRGLTWPVIATTIAAISWAGGAGARVAAPQTAGVTGRPVQQDTQAPVQPPPIPTGVIAGRVTGAGTQTPLARARVVISADPATLPVNRVSLTDDDGRFRFEQLPAGETFVLTAGKTGFATQKHGEMPPTFEPEPIVLTTAEVREDLDFALAPAAGIVGQLLDVDKTPLAGALVEASRAVFEDARRTLVTVADAVTDDHGEFRLDGLPAGQYYLSAIDPAFAGVGDEAGPLSYPDTYFPGVTSPDEATRITVAPGTAPSPAVFVMRIGPPDRLPVTPVAPPTPSAPPVVLTPPEPTPVPADGVLAGRITSRDSGRPIARARVRLSTLDNALAYPRVTLTDADGRYRFSNLPASTAFLVTGYKTGYAARGLGEAPPSTPPRLLRLAAGQVVEDANIALVEQVFVHGWIKDEDDTPFGGALVEALRPIFKEGQRTLVTVAEAISSADGEFRLVGLSPGHYYVSAFDPAYANVGDANGALFYSSTFYPGGVFPDEATRITLEPGVGSDLSFGLRLIKPARVAGQISTRTDESGQAKPLLAAAVVMSPLRNDQFSEFTLTKPTMEPNGRFLFANVPPGRYKIQARGETERGGITLFQIFTLEVSGAPQSTERMVLSKGAVVSGTVEWDSATGQIPASRTGLMVRAPMTDGNLFGDALTGYLGAGDTWTIRGVMGGDHFLRVSGLPAGWALKSVDYMGRDITDAPFTFNYDEVVTGFRIVVTNRVTRVWGYVTPPGRADPQSYAVVVFPMNAVFWRPGSRYVRLTYPDAKGRFEISGLPPAQYMAVASLGIDESDLGNPVVFDGFQGMPGVQRFQLAEGSRWRQDLVPVIRRERH